MAERRLAQARRLRGHMTRAETFLWGVLRGRAFGGLKFRRQAPIGPYIVDFVCLKRRLVVELDGGVHADRVEYDARREAYLRAHGLQVLRFGNTDVLERRDHVAWTILSACRESNPSHRGHRIDRGRRGYS